MSAVKYLKRISEGEKKLILLETELSAFEETFKKTSSAQLKRKISNIIRAIDQEAETLAKLKVEAYYLINQLTDLNQRCVLTYHFICNMPFSEITNIMSYSQRHILRIYESACKNINEHFKKQKHNMLM